MAYTHYAPATPNPDQTGTQFATSARQNLLALRDAARVGTMPNWNMATAGGTAEQPATITYSNGTERLRMTLTWGTSGATDGAVTAIAYAYSNDSGSSYDAMGTETMTYDAGGNVTAINWS